MLSLDHYCGPLALNKQGIPINKKLLSLKMRFYLKCYMIPCGPGSSSDKALGYGLDGQSSIPVSEGMEIFLYFVS